LVRGIVDRIKFSANEDMRQTGRDLGMQMLDGRSLHEYSYTVRGVPVNLYVGPDWLPVESIVHDKNLTTTIVYSAYNTPMTIDAP
jgi:hypothetical protein